MRLGFAGSPAFAVEILNRLVRDSRHEVVRILTQPKKPAGRGRSIVDSPVGTRARQLGIPYLAYTDWPSKKGCRWIDVDVVVVAAYGNIIKPEELKQPRLGWLNVHPSLLPRWRGATPVEHAILSGDAETGVCIMQVSEDLDEGPVFRCEQVSLLGSETARDLSIELAVRGARLLIQLLDGIEDGTEASPVAQSGAGVTYAPRLKPEAAAIDWMRDASEIERQVRGFTNRGGVFTSAGSLRMKIHKAAEVSGRYPPGQFTLAGDALAIGCGRGALVPLSVQLNRGTGKVLATSAAASGYPKIFAPGFQFDVEM